MNDLPAPSSLAEQIAHVGNVSVASAADRVCIVTYEIAGPDFNGGIGTANRCLATELRKHHYEVDVLYTHVNDGVPFCFRGSFAEQVEKFRDLGVRLVCIDNPGRWNDWHIKSYRVMEHLLDQKYKLVMFDDLHGAAYYSLLAKRTGNKRLQDTSICVVAHGPSQWVADLNEEPVNSIETVRLMEMERRSVELADFLIAPSRYMFEKYRSYGWRLPKAHCVLPNLIAGKGFAQSKRLMKVDELVFFGRLERRKGLWTFCAALDRLKYKLAGRIVTFLGKGTFEGGESTVATLLKRSAAWPFTIRLLYDFDRDQAIKYLKSGNRLAIMPSPEDNSPSVIVECLAEGIPFLASSGSGGEELLAAKSRKINMVEPRADRFAERIMATLRDGATPATAGFDPAEVERNYLETLRSLTAPIPAEHSVEEFHARRSMKAHPGETPTMIVIVPDDVGPAEAGAVITRRAGDFEGNVEIEVLAAKPGLETLFSDSAGAAIKVHSIQDYETVAKSLVDRPATVVGVCHVTQMLGPADFHRAQLCLGDHGAVSALTGLVEHLEARQDEELPPYYSPSTPSGRSIDRLLIGNSEVLLPIAQETNSGFVLIRSRDLARLANIVPTDSTYGRAKRMGDWIHEILCELLLRGGRFELAPDLVLGEQVREKPFEVFRLGSVMRGLVHRQLGYAPGSDQALLSRLAIESLSAPARAAATTACLDGLAVKIPNRERHDGQTWGTDRVGKLASMAHASGQIDLSIELLTSLLGESKTTPGALIETLLERAGTIHIADLIADRTAVQLLNLEHDWSLKYQRERREIVLHANSVKEGRAAIEFLAVDLTEAERFACSVSVPEEDARPIRFRVDLIPLDGRPSSTFDKVLASGESANWAVELPDSLRCMARILLSVEMADPLDQTRCAFATWNDPRFLPSLAGEL